MGWLQPQGRAYSRPLTDISVMIERSVGLNTVLSVSSSHIKWKIHPVTDHSHKPPVERISHSSWSSAFNSSLKHASCKMSFAVESSRLCSLQHFLSCVWTRKCTMWEEIVTELMSLLSCVRRVRKPTRINRLTRRHSTNSHFNLDFSSMCFLQRELWLAREKG